MGFLTTGIAHKLGQVARLSKSKTGNATDPGTGQGPTVLPTVGCSELLVPDIVSLFRSETKVSKSAKIPGLNPRSPGS